MKKWLEMLKNVRLPSGLRGLVGYGGYAAFFFASCLFFSYCTFPYDRAREFLEAKVSEQMPGAQLRVVSLKPAWLTGVAAEGVQITLPAATPDERPAMMTFRSLYARLQLLPLLWGEQRVAFALGVGPDGMAEGFVSLGKTADHIQATLTSLDLRQIGAIRSALGLPVQGVANGSIDLTLADEAAASVGSVDLTVTQLAVGDGHAQLGIPMSPGGAPMRLTIDRVDAGTLRIRGPVENATLRLEEFSARGADVDLRGRGSIRFARNLRLSTVPELMLRIEVKEGYRNRSERAQAIFSLLESPSPLDPNTTIAGPFRASDGAYQVRLGGPLFRMTATPAGTASIR